LTSICFKENQIVRSGDPLIILFHDAVCVFCNVSNTC
jgi:hypothetical protein